MISFANFGNPDLPHAEVLRDAVGVLDRRDVGFEYEGEMSAGVALNPDMMANYPFCRLSGPANVLVMPGLHSSRISVRLLSAVGGATVLGPILLGFSKPALSPPAHSIPDHGIWARGAARPACGIRT